MSKSRAWFREKLSVILALKLMTVELLFRYLAKHDLIARGEVGKRTDDFTAEHLKNFFLALAAHQMSDAAEAVATLDPLPFGNSGLAALAFPNVPAWGIVDGTTFGEWIRDKITDYSTPEGQAAFLKEEAERQAAELEPRVITMDLENGRVVVRVPKVSLKKWDADFYFFRARGRGFGEFHPIKRETTVRWDVLAAAGRLLMEANKPQSDLLSGNNKAKAASKAQPKSKKADLPGRKSALSEASIHTGNRLDAAAHEEIGSLDSSDDTSCVCPSSSGSRSPRKTQSHEHHEPHHGAGL